MLCSRKKWSIVKAFLSSEYPTFPFSITYNLKHELEFVDYVGLQKKNQENRIVENYLFNAKTDFAVNEILPTAKSDYDGNTIIIQQNDHEKRVQ